MIRYRFKRANPGGYSHCGLTGGPVRVKKAQSKNFENYPQMVVSFYKNPQMELYEPENFVIPVAFSVENFTLTVFHNFLLQNCCNKVRKFQNSFTIIVPG